MGFKDVRLTWLLIWAADLCDLGLHIIGLFPPQKNKIQTNILLLKTKANRAY